MTRPKIFLENPDFLPDSLFRNRWLLTRKKKLAYGDFTLPGLFQTYNFPLDRFLFCLSIIGEFWGLINLMNVMSLILVFKVAIVFGGILFDISCAVFAHWNAGNKCKAHTTITLLRKGLLDNTIEGDDSLTREGQISIWKSKIKAWNFYSWFFKFLIILLAITKILFFKANAPAGNPLVLPIIATYILVALIHIYSTGYFGSEQILRLFYFNPQFKRFKNHKEEFTVKDNDILGDRYIVMPANINIQAYNDPGKTNLKHQIIVDQENKRYKLITHGLLTDYELNELIKSQEGDEAAKEEIGFKCLHRQYESLN